MQDRKNKKSWRVVNRKDVVGYLFLLPLILGLCFIYVPVLIQSFLFSVSDMDITSKGLVMEYAGFGNYYKAFFVDPSFRQLLLSSLGDMLINVPTIIIFSFFIANVLNQKFFGRLTARVIFFIPVIIATGIISAAESGDLLLASYQSGGKLDMGLEAQVFSYQTFMDILSNAGLGDTFVSIIEYAIDRLYTIVTSCGVQLLIFLAGLQSIPVSMFEAAKVEGATQWEIFWKISFPYISPLILLNLVYTVIDCFFSFKNAMISTITSVLKNPAQYSWGTALAWIYMGIAIVFLVIIWAAVRKFIVYQE
ncbi:MAG: sugar ABC transporter permease [Clostridiales bacterium]|nr:sugar ABC transporter permease [Clostridiales bacterium]